MTKVNMLLEPGVDGKLIFYAGHLIKGVVELHLNSVKKFRGLHVTIYGAARAHWTEVERSWSNNRNRNRRRHFEGQEVYINTRTYLFGQSGGPTFEMQPGIHRYEFACQLPQHTPYTVCLRHADIGYYAEAVLDIPWKIDKDCKIPLIIIPYEDLNFYENLRIPQRVEMSKTTCSLLCSTGRIKITAHLPYTGFAVGQKVTFRMDYVNESNVSVSRTKIILKRITQYMSQIPYVRTKVKTEDMFFAITGGVKAGLSTSFESAFEIPKVMLCTNVGYCRIASISYMMQIVAELGMFHSNPKVIFPVTIGTVPIVEQNQIAQITFENPAPAPFATPVPGPFVQPSAPVQEQFNSDFPPSFDEATKEPEKQNLALMQEAAPLNIGWNS